MNNLLNKLPWRVQSWIGYRPRRVIETIEEMNSKHLRKGSYTLELDEDLFPVNCEDYLPIEITSINKKKIFEKCSFFYVAELTNTAYLNVGGFDAIIKNGVILQPFSFMKDWFGLNKDFNHPALSIYKYPVAKKLKGKTLSLVTMGATSCYGHWIVDLIPKLGFIEFFGYSLSEFDHILINKAIFPYQIELIQILQIPREKIIETIANDYIVCEKLVIASCFPHSMYGFKFIKETLVGKDDISNIFDKRIYLSRRKDKVRKISNEDEIIPVLIKYGFEIMDFENITVAEQIQLMKDVAFLISPQGSGLANVIFLNSKAKVIEIYNKDFINPTFYVYGMYNRNKYGVLMADPDSNSDYSLMNMHVDPIKLETLIQKLC